MSNHGMYLEGRLGALEAFCGLALLKLLTASQLQQLKNDLPSSQRNIPRDCPVDYRRGFEEGVAIMTKLIEWEAEDKI